MEIETDSKAIKSKRKSSHVRLSDDELEQLEKDQYSRGMSIPDLLKEAYFKGRPTAILMTQEDRKMVLTEIARQGNNLNQLAKKVNAGIQESVQGDVSDIKRILTGILALLNGKIVNAKA